MNGELVKAADYNLHARELNTARCRAQDLPKLFLFSIVAPFPTFSHSLLLSTGQDGR
jgi:hypothetical protein